jgi:hypothetical protein
MKCFLAPFIIQFVVVTAAQPPRHAPAMALVTGLREECREIIPSFRRQRVEGKVGHGLLQFLFLIMTKDADKIKGA